MILFINGFLSKMMKIVLYRFLKILTFNEIVLQVNDTVERFLGISAIVEHCFVKQR